MTSRTLKLDRAERAQLIRIGAGGRDGMPAAGYTASAAEIRLAMRGLIRHWTVGVPIGVGDLSVTVRLAELTDAGHDLHASLGLPPSARDAAFLARGRGVCEASSAVFAAVRARGYVEIEAEMGGIVVWGCTKAGKDALLACHRATATRPEPVSRIVEEENA